MFYEYVNILNKGDILIILVSGFSIFPHQKKYLLMRIFYVLLFLEIKGTTRFFAWVGGQKSFSRAERGGL